MDTSCRVRLVCFAGGPGAGKDAAAQVLLDRHGFVLFPFVAKGFSRGAFEALAARPGVRGVAVTEVRSNEDARLMQALGGVVVGVGAPTAVTAVNVLLVNDGSLEQLWGRVEAAVFG